MDSPSSQIKTQLTSLWALLESPANVEAVDKSHLQQHKVDALIKAIKELKIDLGPVDTSFDRYLTLHDGQVHDPLGAGSYYFQRAFVRSTIQNLGLPLLNQISNQDLLGHTLPPTTVVIHTGAQPNSSPHCGTLVVFYLTFLVAKAIETFYKGIPKHGLPGAFSRWIDALQIVVQLDLVDTAPDNSASLERNGVKYQRSLRTTKAFLAVKPDYEEIMALAAAWVGGTIPFEVKAQTDLTTMPSVPKIVETIVKDRERIGSELAPDTGVLAIRAACPHESCGLSDKHGIKNVYTAHPSGSVTISFECCTHGRHTISTSKPEEVAKLEFNTPLRNLVRAIAFGIETRESRKTARDALEGGKDHIRERVHLRVTGADYAGFYSEQMLWRQLLLMAPKIPPPVIIYAPLIVDWAGSKISKSLYVKHGAYAYLKEAEKDYLLSYAKMKMRNENPETLFRVVEKWLASPAKLFRSYSAEYIHLGYQ